MERTASLDTLAVGRTALVLHVAGEDDMRRRLMELAESISEIKSVCDCGAKATVNARIDENGDVVFEGDQVVLGGNDRYHAMCRKCWLRKKKEQEARKNGR